MNWIQNQQNEIKFVMIDTNGNEVSGLGSGFTLEVSKPGDEVFVAGAGVKSEIGNGWYRYLATTSEADTLGQIAIKVTGTGAIQQNLVYEIDAPEIEAEDVWTYGVRTLTSPTGQSQGPIVIPPAVWDPP